MRYKVYCESPVVESGVTVWRRFTLLDYDIEGRELPSAVLTRGFQDTLQDATYTFSIHPQHPYYDVVMLSQSTIIAYDVQNGVAYEVFRGRPISVDTATNKIKTFTCEHMFKFLIDVPDVFSEEDEEGNVYIRDAMQACIAGYNSWVPDSRKIYLDNPNDIPADATASASRGATIYSNVQQWLASIGYYARIVWSATQNGYAIHVSQTSGVPLDDFAVVFGESVIDYAETANLDQLYTACYPYGRGTKPAEEEAAEEEGEEPEEETPAAPAEEDTSNEREEFSVTLENAAGVYTDPNYPIDALRAVIGNQVAANAYGLVVMYAELDMSDIYAAYQEQYGDVPQSYLQQELYNFGLQEFLLANQAAESFTVSAVDPRLIGIDAAVPVEGCYYMVTIPLLPEPTRFKLVEVVTDMTTPSAGSLTFGMDRKLIVFQAAQTMVDVQRVGKDLEKHRKRTKKEIDKINNWEHVDIYGKKSGWTYRKWNSGKAEAFYTAEVTVSTMTQVGQVFAYDGIVTLPVDVFSEIPSEVYANPTGAFWAGGAYASDATTVNYTLYSHEQPASAATVKLNIHVIGTWEEAEEQNEN